MPSKYDPELKAKAVRLVREHRDDYETEWAAIRAVSSRLGMSAETLRKWVRQAEVDEGQAAGMTTRESQELRELRKKNRELEETNRDPQGGNKFLRAGERPATPLICAFIAEHRARFGVAPICRVLSEHGCRIAPRTFYAWLGREPSKRALWDMTVTEVLAGTLTSIVAGWLADSRGRALVLGVTLPITVIGLLATVPQALVAIVIGAGVFTGGFFSAHTVASGWVGAVARQDRAEASALYLFSYYLGGSVAGALGGLIYSVGGWTATVAFVSALLLVSLLLVALLVRESGSAQRLACGDPRKVLRCNGFHEAVRP
jgi:transposase-like protein